MTGVHKGAEFVVPEKTGIQPKQKAWLESLPAGLYGGLATKSLYASDRIAITQLGSQAR